MRRGLRCSRQGITVGTACNCRPLLAHPLSSLSAQLIPPACRRSCDRACGASRFSSSLSKRTWRPSSPWPPRERPCLSPAIFLAYNICAGFAGLAAFSSVSSSTDRRKLKASFTYHPCEPCFAINDFWSCAVMKSCLCGCLRWGASSFLNPCFRV